MWSFRHRVARDSKWAECSLMLASHKVAVSEAQKTTETERSHILVPRPNIRRIPEIMSDRILMFMWSFGTLRIRGRCLRNI